MYRVVIEIIWLGLGNWRDLVTLGFLVCAFASNRREAAANFVGTCRTILLSPLVPRYAKCAQTCSLFTPFDIWFWAIWDKLYLNKATKIWISIFQQFRGMVPGQQGQHFVRAASQQPFHHPYGHIASSSTPPVVGFGTSGPPFPSSYSVRLLAFPVFFGWPFFYTCMIDSWSCSLHHHHLMLRICMHLVVSHQQPTLGLLLL